MREGRPLIEGQDLLARRRDDLEPECVEYIEVSHRSARRARRRRVGIISSVVATFFGVVSGFGAFSYAQWQEAEAQKQISERQKTMAMEALDQWTYKVPEKLARIPGARPIIADILRKYQAARRNNRLEPGRRCRAARKSLQSAKSRRYVA